jgi:hypothetical protein
MQIRGYNLTAKRIQAEDVSQQRDFYRALCQERRKTTKGKLKERFAGIGLQQAAGH